MIPVLATLGAMIVVTHTVRHLAGWFGERWGGLLVGLPISTALTLFYCLWEHGPHYAATAARAGLLGLGAAVAFAVVAAQCLSRSPWLALAVAAGVVTYVAAALAVRGASTGLTAQSALLSLALIAVGHWTVRGLRGRVRGGGARWRLSPGGRLLLRTALPVACLAAVLLLVRNAEASWAGLFGTFPGTTLAVLVVTSLEAGPGAAVELLRTYPLGKCSTLAFLAAFALLTPALGPVAGYAVGYVAAGGVLAGLAWSSWPVPHAEPALGFASLLTPGRLPMTPRPGPHEAVGLCPLGNVAGAAAPPCNPLHRPDSARAPGRRSVVFLTDSCKVFRRPAFLVQGGDGAEAVPLRNPTRQQGRAVTTAAQHASAAEFALRRTENAAGEALFPGSRGTHQ
jgi:hypothetical protein